PTLPRWARVATGVAAAGVIAWIGTAFPPVHEVLALHTWGAGTPTTTRVTAFATLRPWWIGYEPEAVRVKDDGGIEAVVRVPRAEVRSTGRPVLPSRGIGYELVLGLLTALRSLASTDLIYDFRLYLLFQRAALLLALALAPLALYYARPEFRNPGSIWIYNLANLPLLIVWPHGARYLTEGIVDSALAPACAVASVGALVLILRGLRLETRTGTLGLVSAALFLGFCTMIRAEFLAIDGFALAILALPCLRERRRFAGLGLAAALLIAVPVAYGVANHALFGRFVPLRLQSGQNLVEPIGQFPNPYGIRYDDAWLDGYLRAHGHEYFGLDTDRFLTGVYVRLLRDDPRLFLTNLDRRLTLFSRWLRVPLNSWTLPLVLALALVLAWRDPRFLPVSLPLMLVIGYLLLFGWTNSLFRLVAPAHFLLTVFGGYAAAYAAARLRARRPGYTVPP
ncbi:MAG TPA: hypothetical protein VNL37_03500, partial [Candidatus Polarisedimenticolia bacterium]|nr:hypothetical protein [Candidatus Polarisedimenticolia bacterium]